MPRCRGPRAELHFCSLSRLAVGRVPHIRWTRLRARWSGLRAGGNGFGYDPMFIADGETLTFGEMEPAAKYAISHLDASASKPSGATACRMR